jgi:hypothetical protein
MKASRRVDIQGHVSAGFEPVREAFAENFSRRRELGGACCVYHRGRKVVDPWGGVRNNATGEPWEEGTMVVVYSTTMMGLKLRVRMAFGAIGSDGVD